MRRSGRRGLEHGTGPVVRLRDECCCGEEMLRKFAEASPTILSCPPPMLQSPIHGEGGVEASTLSSCSQILKATSQQTPTVGSPPARLPAKSSDLHQNERCRAPLCNGSTTPAHLTCYRGRHYTRLAVLQMSVQFACKRRSLPSKSGAWLSHAGPTVGPSSSKSSRTCGLIGAYLLHRLAW